MINFQFRVSVSMKDVNSCIYVVQILSFNYILYIYSPIIYTIFECFSKRSPFGKAINMQSPMVEAMLNNQQQVCSEVTSSELMCFGVGIIGMGSFSFDNSSKLRGLFEHIDRYNIIFEPKCGNMFLVVYINSRYQELSKEHHIA